MVERSAHNRLVTGSNPVGPTPWLVHFCLRSPRVACSLETIQANLSPRTDGLFTSSPNLFMRATRCSLLSVYITGYPKNAVDARRLQQQELIQFIGSII